MLKIVVFDAVHLVIPAVLLAAVVARLALYVLSVLELLSVFGVRSATGSGPVLLLASLLGAVGIAVCSAAFVLLPALRSSPTAVWQGDSQHGSLSGSDDGQPNGPK